MEVPSLPMTCSLATFLSHWERTRCVHLRHGGASGRGRSRAKAPIFAPALDVLEECCSAESSFTAESGGSAVAAAEEVDAAARRPRPQNSSACRPASGTARWSSRCSPSRAALLESSSGGATLLFGRCHHGKMAQESALWFFVGRNSGDDALPGRPPHTDEVKHDGTYHRQLSGCKEWRVRPTEELLARGRRSMASTSRGRSRKRSRAAAAEEEEGAEEDDEGSGKWRIVRCEAGDVLAISTRDWWHSTSLPPRPASPSPSRAVERARGHAAAEDEGERALRGGRAGGRWRGRRRPRHLVHECGWPVRHARDRAGLRHPSPRTIRRTWSYRRWTRRANCEVAEDEETGKMCLVARRPSARGVPQRGH